MLQVQMVGGQIWLAMDKVIDTRVYTVLAFNIPGNGYDGFLIENYKDFVARDIAKLFLNWIRKTKYRLGVCM